MLDRYLRELEREMALVLSPEDVQSRLSEAEAHLRDGVEGRLELGLDLEAAKREAIAAFGRVRPTARAIAQAVQARSIVLRLRLLAAGYASVTASLLAATWLLELTAYAALLPLACLALTAIGLGVGSFHARRAAPLPIVAVGLVATLGIWGVMGASFLNLWNYGGEGFVPRWSATRLTQEGLANPKGADAYVSEVDRAHERVEAIREAQADSLGNFVSQAGPAFAPGMGIASFAVLIDVAFAGLGAASSARRRRRAGLA